jgi:hypothetical protein
MRTRTYLLAAALVLLGACGDPTGPDLLTDTGTDAATGEVISPQMDPVRLNGSR